MRKRIILLLATILVLGFGAVEAAPERIVEVPQRIVSLVPSITENLFALGVGERVVGVTSWCDYPAEAAAKPIISDAVTVNLELLLSLGPDLVVGDTNLVSGHLEQIEALGIPTFAVAPNTIEQIQRSLIELGQAVGAEEQGRKLAEAMEERLRGLVGGIHRTEAPRVFLEIWNEPLMTVGPGTFMDELIVLAGGQNIAGDSPTPWPVFSEELVIERDPQVVILTGFNLEEALSRKAWENTSAFKLQAVFEVNPDLYARSSSRILDALEELITILDAVKQ